jgi:hypothetical protein
MTTGAADFIVVMRAAVPRDPGIGCMTTEAHTILRCDTGGRVCGETDDRWSFLSTPDPAGMRSTGTVTGLALQLTLTERATRISRHAVLCPEYGKDHLIAMTGEAGICAAPAVGNIGCRFVRSLRPADH